MKEFSALSSDPSRTPEMRTMQRWVEKYLCGVTPSQQVVGNRRDPNGIVTQYVYDQKDRRAHVCPFVQDTLDRSRVSMEQSDCDGSDEPTLIQVLLDQIPSFLASPLPFDPAVTSAPAGVPHLWKTFITFFPRIRYRKGHLPLFERVQGALKLQFVQRGLMIGQFYHGCPQPGLYNPAFRPLVAPYPTFAIRYMVQDDKLFNSGSPSIFSAYRKFFP